MVRYALLCAIVDVWFSVHAFCYAFSNYSYNPLLLPFRSVEKNPEFWYLERFRDDVDLSNQQRGSVRLGWRSEKENVIWSELYSHEKGPQDASWGLLKIFYGRLDILMAGWSVVRFVWNLWRGYDDGLKKENLEKCQRTALVMADSGLETQEDRTFSSENGQYMRSVIINLNRGLVLNS